MVTATDFSPQVKQQHVSQTKLKLSLILTRFFRGSWSSFLALVMSAAMGLLAFHGAKVLLWPSTVVWLTAAVVALVELSLLTVMTRNGVNKFHAGTMHASQEGQSGQDIEINGRVSHFNPHECEFYLSRAHKQFRTTTAHRVADAMRHVIGVWGLNHGKRTHRDHNDFTIDVVVNDSPKHGSAHNHATTLRDIKQVDGAISALCDWFDAQYDQAVRDQVWSQDTGRVQKLQSLLDELLAGLGPSNSMLKPYMNVRLYAELERRWHEKSHHEGSRAHREISAWYYRVFKAQKAHFERKVIEKQSQIKTNQRAYRRRGWFMQGLALLVIAPSSFFIGQLCFHLASEVMGSLSGMLLGAQYMFAFFCALSYFYQLYQTISTWVLSGAGEQWWQHLKMACKELMHGHLLWQWTKVFLTLCVASIFLVLSVIATVCTAGEYLKLLATNPKWLYIPTTIVISITEGLYGLIYTVRSNDVINRHGPLYASLLAKHRLPSKIRTYCNEMWGAFYSNYGSIGDWWRLLFVTPAWILHKICAVVVVSFELVVFIGHAVLLGLQGVDNNVFGKWLSVIFETGNEVLQDAALYFEGDDHEHGLFDVLCRVIYASVTFVPACLTYLGFVAVPGRSSAPLYQVVVSGKQYVVGKYDFAHLWGRHFFEFSTCVNQKRASKPAVSWAAVWSTVKRWCVVHRWKILAALLVIVVLAVCFVPPVATALLPASHAMLPFLPAHPVGAMVGLCASLGLLNILLMCAPAWSLGCSIYSYVCMKGAPSVRVARDKITAFQGIKHLIDSLKESLKSSQTGPQEAPIKASGRSSGVGSAEARYKLASASNVVQQLRHQQVTKEGVLVAYKAFDQDLNTRLCLKRMTQGSSSKTATWSLYKNDIRPVLTQAVDWLASGRKDSKGTFFGQQLCDQLDHAVGQVDDRIGKLQQSIACVVGG